MFSFVDLRSFCTRTLSSALALAAVFSLVPLTNSLAEDFSRQKPEQVREANELFVPTEYGRIIYQKNADAPQQIYIIGQSHRSAVSGRNSEEIVQVQTEIFRIGEWLIQEKNVGMLLPEGFFQKLSDNTLSGADVVRENVGLDNQTLQNRLGDPEKFVNADQLLNASYKVPMGQVENEALYRDICRLLQEANRESNLSILSRIHGLQGQRTVVMLQNIPDIVDQAFAEGRIAHRRAMFTIGLGHVGEIIDFLRQGSVRHPGGSERTEGEMMAEASLKLLDQGYGVTIIIPRTLADNKQLLRLARLETE